MSAVKTHNPRPTYMITSSSINSSRGVIVAS